MRRPVVTVLGTSIVLILIASPVLKLRMGQADFTSFPDSLDSVQAINVLNAKWPTGSAPVPTTGNTAS